MKKKSAFSAVFYGLFLSFWYSVCQYAVAYGIQFYAIFAVGMSEQAVEEFYRTYLYPANFLGGLLFLGTVLLFQRERFFSNLGARKIKALPAASALLLGAGAYSVCIALMNVATKIPSVAQSMEEYTAEVEIFSGYTTSPFWEIAAVIVLAPLVEEILFRGLILSRLKQSMSPAAAIVISAFFFAWFHGNVYQGIYTFVVGLALGFLVHRFASLWYGVLLHFTMNSMTLLMDLPRMFPTLFSERWEVVWCFAVLIFSPFALGMGLLLLRWALSAEKERKIPEEIASDNKEERLVASPEFLIVGLGNPGEKYAVTRHNCGFMALDYIALRENVSFRNLKFKSLVAEVDWNGAKCLLMKPQTFMNLSGEAVREAASFYKIPPEKILVLFDDINFEPGVFRIRQKGSAGGHNGIKSIIACLGSDQFPRVKMGVGQPPEGWDLMHHVLGAFSDADREKHLNSLEDVYQTAKLFAAENLDLAVNRYSGKSHGAK